MALNLDSIGKPTDKIPYTYDQDAVMLYALGIGAGVEELDFVYEKNLKVFPTFAVIPTFDAIFTTVATAGLNLPTVLHGEQKIIIEGEEGTDEFIVKTGDTYIVPASFSHKQITIRDAVTIDAWSIAP